MVAEPWSRKRARDPRPASRSPGGSGQPADAKTGPNPSPPSRVLADQPSTTCSQRTGSDISLRSADLAQSVQHREQWFGHVQWSVVGKHPELVGLAAHGRDGMEGAQPGELFDGLQDAGAGVAPGDLVGQLALLLLELQRVVEVAAVQREA